MGTRLGYPRSRALTQCTLEYWAPPGSPLLLLPGCTELPRTCQIWIRLWHGMSNEIFLPMVSKMRVIMDLGKVIDDYATNKLMPIPIVLLS